MSTDGHSHLGSLGLQQTGHVFDTQNVDSFLDQLIDEVEVVFQGILGLCGTGNISAVANDGFTNTAGLLRSIYAKSHLRGASETDLFYEYRLLTFSIAEN